MKTISELQADVDLVMQAGNALGAKILLNSVPLLANQSYAVTRYALIRAAAGVVGSTMAQQEVSPAVFDESLKLITKIFEQLARDAFLATRYPTQPPAPPTEVQP